VMMGGGDVRTPRMLWEVPHRILDASGIRSEEWFQVHRSENHAMRIEDEEKAAIVEHLQALGYVE
jgi:hypothetical protein